MIDKKTQAQLNKVGRLVMDEKKKTSKWVKPHQEEKEKLEWTLKKLEEDNGDGADKKTNAKAAHAIRKMLASGDYDRTEEVVDDERLDRLWKAKVDKMIRQGRIQKVDVDNDPFLKRLRKKRHAQALRKQNSAE